MTSLSRGSVSSVKKAASTADAPIWKAYLAIRSSSSRDAADHVNKSSINGKVRGRKRAKASASRIGPGVGVWMTMATPLGRGGDGSREDGAAVLASVQQYWEQLSVNERQQILFLDEPELVKQLYKLNLSLLCVGLMQRHLKTSNRTATDTAVSNKKTATTMGAPKVADPATATVIQESSVATTTPSTRSVTDTSSEKTYELLEAMEFMDIGTGILTVKTELAEDTGRLFTLVGDVLAEFLTSVHVLTESSFTKLFVTESETINTWANYQRLIAMLVEQLILRSYVGHLEKEAAQQMEQLLLEVSLEDTVAGQHASTGNPSSHNNKKSKKKKKRKPTVHATTTVQNIDPSEAFNDPEGIILTPDDRQVERDGSTVAPSDNAMEDEPTSEPTPDSLDSVCRPVLSTESIKEITLDVDEAKTAEVETSLKKASGLNPNALIFQPKKIAQTTEDFDVRIPYAGKRKFDEYVVSVPWEDVDSELGSAFDCRSVDADLSDVEDEIDYREGHQQWRRKQRRREEDAKLEWQLQQVYASTSSLFGWDFSRQCELPDPGANLPWSESTLWRTAPKEVVRYFSPGNGDAYSRFHAPQFLPGPPPSRYYFNPGPTMPFGPPLLPPPGMEQIPPHLHGNFGFELPAVVSSPDFTDAQYHPSNHEDEVDV